MHPSAKKLARPWDFQCWGETLICCLSSQHHKLGYTNCCHCQDTLIYSFVPDIAFIVITFIIFVALVKQCWVLRHIIYETPSCLLQCDDISQVTRWLVECVPFKSVSIPLIPQSFDNFDNFHWLKGEILIIHLFIVHLCILVYGTSMKRNGFCNHSREWL